MCDIGRLNGNECVYVHIQSRLSVLTDRQDTIEIRQTDVPILDVLALSCSSSGFRPQGSVNEMKHSFIMDSGKILLFLFCALG